jgi:hypothetical protein
MGGLKGRIDSVSGTIWNDWCVGVDFGMYQFMNLSTARVRAKDQKKWVYIGN